MVRTTRPLVERMTLVWHDWFATSNAGVGSQKLMLEQNQLLRRLALGLVRHAAARGHARPGDAALALGHREHEVVAERELRARADGAVHARRGQRLHRARRPRAGARADRLRQRLEARRRQRNFRFDRERHDARQQADLRQARHASTGGTPSASASTTRSTRRSSSTSSGATSSRSRRTPATRRSLEALYRKDYEIRPVRRGDPPPPGALHRPAHGEAAGRLHRRPAARARPRHRHDLVGLARRRGRPAALHPAERRRLGRRALARHRHLPRPLVRRELRDASRTRSPTSRRPSCPPSRRRSSTRALAFWGTPTLRPATRAALLDASRRAMGDANASGSRRYRPRANAVRQLLAVSPDLQTS